MRRYVALLLAAFACSPASVSPPESTGPRLVVVVAVDQLRFDSLTRFDALYKGGLRTLIDRGAVFTNANYRHAATETGPGHSVLLSGRHPSHSGIVANEWYDPYLRKVINVIDDPVQTTLGGSGRRASPVNALGFTVGDTLKARTPESRVVGIAMKDRSAILMGGLRADAAYWFENAGGNFVTSSFYMDAAPAWLTEWNRRRAVDRFADRPWNRLLDDPAVYERYAGIDAVEGERDRKDTTFPHLFTARPPQAQYYVEVRRTPFADEILAEFVVEAIKQHDLGRDGITDILAISFTSTDGIGHAYGADSHEYMDEMLRLDVVLGRLLKEIDATVGLSNTIFVLSSDHGSRPLVEVQQQRGIAARRVAPVVLRTAVADAFAKHYPGVNGLISYFAGDFYLDVDTMRRHNLRRRDVERTAIEALLATGVVDKVYTHDDLRDTGSSSDPFLTLFKNGFYEPRSPHLNVLLKKDVYLHAAAGGTGHGSPYDFDRHVPVVFMGRGITAGKYRDPSGPEDVAPTLAHLLQLEFPREWDARLLTEMLSR
ncbi:MAG TPA: alkaline phosphatase family protein [Vicinamibacterales bacterium]|nr:alkaline phosphatase family protein [Vicinamibacterales bacterium]